MATDIEIIQATDPADNPYSSVSLGRFSPSQVLPAGNFIMVWLTKHIFEIKYTPPYEMPKWRNWQTRYVQGVVRAIS